LVLLLVVVVWSCRVLEAWPASASAAVLESELEEGQEFALEVVQEFELAEGQAFALEARE
jgi:predicted HAD superfamily phosphohydrolase